MTRRSLPLSIALLLGLPTLASGQGPTETSLARFFPAALPGLSDRPPAWEAPRSPGASLWGWDSPDCTWQALTGEGVEPPVAQCPGYVRASVNRQYFIPDTTLERRVAELEHGLEGPRAHMVQLFQQGKTPSQTEMTEINRMSRTQDSLKASARHIWLEIHTNVTPGGDETSAGSVAGHPAYRRGYDRVTLSVFVAPAGFSAPAPDGQHHEEVRCIYLTAFARERDVALAQALLEKVDYAGLAQLIHP
jgi:hypothetical protein